MSKTLPDIDSAIGGLVEMLRKHQHDSYAVGWFQGLLRSLMTDSSLKLNPKQRQALVDIISRDAKYAAEIMKERKYG